MSAPAQKVDPAPVKTTALTSGSASASIKPCRSPSNMTSSNALRFSGRCNVNRRTPGQGFVTRTDSLFVAPSLSEDKQDGPFLDEVALFHPYFFYRARCGRGNRHVHFHR